MIRIVLPRPPSEAHLALLRGAHDDGATPLTVRVLGARTVEISRPDPRPLRVVYGPTVPPPELPLSPSEVLEVEALLVAIATEIGW